jgi:hypothetical protein
LFDHCAVDGQNGIVIEAKSIDFLASFALNAAIFMSNRLGVPWNGSGKIVNKVGSGTLTFSDNDTGRHSTTR